MLSHLVIRASWIFSILSLFITVSFSSAQPQEKQPPEKKPPTEQRRVKEDDDNKSDAKKNESPFKQAQPKQESKPVPKEQSISSGPFNLGEEAKAAKHPEVQKLLNDLATPMDIVTSDSGKVYKNTPIPKKYNPQEAGSLTFKTLEGATLTLPRQQIKEVSQYETRALQAVRQFLEKRFDAPQGKEPALSRFEQLRTAEKILTEVGSFHKNTLSQNTRDPRSWAGTADEIAGLLFTIRIDELRALQAERDYLESLVEPET